jgi:hypothetical protein
MIALVAMTSVACAASTLATNHIKLMLSRGVMANSVKLNYALSGVPAGETDFEDIADELFPIEVGAPVLTFPDSLTSFEPNVIVLTEDGLWGVARLTSTDGQSDFISEEDIRRIVEDAKNHKREWDIVISNGSAGNAIGLKRGEVFPVTTDKSGAKTAIFEEGESLTAFRFGVLESFVADHGLPDSVKHDGLDFFVKLNDKEKAHVRPLDLVKLTRRLNELDDRNAHPNSYWPFGGLTPDPLLSKWRTTVWLESPFNLNCNTVTIEKRRLAKQFDGELSGKLDLPVIDQSLIKIGVTISGSGKVSRSSEIEIVSTVKDTSVAVDSYLLASGSTSTIVSMGVATNCFPPNIKFFVAEVPNIPGRAIDVQQVEEMHNLPSTKIDLAESGYLQIGCLTDYKKTLNYLIRQQHITEPIARLIAAHIIQVQTDNFPQPDDFLDC